MAQISFEKYGPEYQQLWDTMKIIRDAKQLDRVSNLIKKHQSVYEGVQKETGVPWQLIAVIHLREAGESDIGKWKGVLHNGQKIVGTGRKTTIVPMGRGPFKTWHEAAVDAIKFQGFTKIKEWTVARMLWALEPYNGYGYRMKGLRSPYLWASTNHQQRGKYVSDGVFNANVMDTQMGCAALLKFLGVGTKASVPSIIGGGVAVGGGAVLAAAPQYWMYIVPVIVIAAAVGIYYWWTHKDV